jgi:hypothetical protein
MDNSNVDHPHTSLKPDIYNANWLDLKCMPNLSGRLEIQTCYFNNNEIQAIYPDLLPPNVKEVNFYGNSLKAEGLPLRWLDTIETIVLDRNLLATTNTIAEWSASLKSLSIDDNPLSDIPQRLPDSLSLLSMSYCDLKTLTVLPSQLKQLRAYYNKIIKIDKLPESLEYVHLAYNQLQSPAMFRYKLPPTLRFMNLDYNKLTILPETLPNTLETLSVVGNMLKTLPAHLPASLRMLIANKNRIREFKPSWKPGQRLFQLHIRDNCLTENLIVLKNEERVEDIFQANNWNQVTHTVYALRIQHAFMNYKLRLGFRAWSRLGRVRQELIEVSHLPELVIKYHDIESVRLGGLRP